MTWSVGTMMLTLVHHFYGALIYSEPFRLHVAIVAIPVILVLLAAYISYLRTHNPIVKKRALVTFLVVSVLFSVLAIGFYEGGYNHVVKNILYFSGMSTDVLDAMYPSVYELPEDVFFELTGMAQFASGLLCTYEMLRLPIRRWLELLNARA